ncbi:lamin tail domain-containing protein [Candidatus Uhrbacteria bacterium]|nr:lamin tail domain-containing protein [Candidatus Uhrbacteria bacterium]
MLKLFDYRWLAVVMLLTVAALPVRIQASTPTIVFSEIAWAGSSISASDEWIELTNVSDATIDLSGWTVTGAGSSGKDLVLPEGATIAPHSTYLITNYEYAHENTVLAAQPNFVTATLSLPNGGFDLRLLDNGNTLVDVAGGAGAPFAGRSGGTASSDYGRYRSMVRTSRLGDGALPESWADADSSQGFLEGVNDLGTPGVVAFATIESDVPKETVDEELVEEPVIEEVVEEVVVEGTAAEEVATEEPIVEESIVEEVIEGTVEEVTDVAEEEVEETVVVEEIVEETVEEVEAEVVVEETAVSVVTDIHINEFVVDPLEDGVEWIELYNAGDTPVSLEGWSIEDESGGSTDLSNMTIEMGGYLLIEEPKGKLNNDGDTVVLKDANGSVVESVIYGNEGYPTPKDGEALARNGGTFEVTELPTPGSVNLIFVAVEKIEEVVETAEEPESTVIPSETSEASEAEGSQVEEIVEKVELIKTLRFVSLYPNATGSDEEEEYIEIENIGTEAIDLQGWSIEDGSTDRHTFESSVMIEAGVTFILGRPESKLTLNNGGDTIELIAPDGEVIDLVTYSTSAKGATYDLVNGTWAWSVAATVAESTPVATTTSTTTSNASESNTTATYVSTGSRVVQSITVAQAQEKSDGQYVSIKGIVPAAPGMFGTQIFYLQDETGGIQIYLYSSDFPELLVGDIVQVSGEMSTSRGERRVKLSGSLSVVPASGSFESGATSVSIGDVSESLVGMLLTTTGMIQSIDTNKLVIEQFGATLTVYLKSNPTIDANQFERGDTINVTGVLTTYDDELRLRPRGAADISVTEQAPVATAAMSETPDGGSNAGLILLFSTVAALGALALWRYMPRRRLTPASA